MTNQRKITIVFILLLTIISFDFCAIHAQKFTTSPYSRFGLGELASQGTARNRAMGGTGIALRDGFYLNTLNPASYTTLDSTSFIFDIGATGNITQLKSASASESNNQANFEYFALGFSVKKWWAMSAGVRKVTNVGYDLNFTFEDAQAGTYTANYVGDGGINKVYLANAFQITPNFSVGLNANYNWGKITKTRAIAFQGGGGLPFNSEEVLTVSNLNFDAGFQYSMELKENEKLTIGAIIGKKTDLTGDYSYLSYRNNPSEIISEENSEDNTVELPNRFGIGLAFTNKKLTLAADAHYQAWGNVASLSTENAEVAIKLKNSYKMALGLEYSPNRFSGRKFFDRVNYRTGVFYNNSHVEINGTQLHEFGVTAGLGIPVRRSYVNLALELGTRGTTDNNLIKENYAKISIGFTLFETWFQKVLYD